MFREFLIFYQQNLSINQIFFINLKIKYIKQIISLKYNIFK